VEQPYLLSQGKPKKKEAVEAVPENIEADRIIRVIQKHPEGIRLVDLGNALGVNWRSLISAVRHLLDEGKIGKLDNIYYPVMG